MNITLKYDLKEIDWQALAEVFEKVRWGKRDPEKLKHAFEKSYVKCFAYTQDRLIGAARAISDGEYYATIFDVVVVPEFQHHGAGKQMMNFLMENLSTMQVVLISIPGKESFYSKFQFRRNKTAMTRYPKPDRAEAAGLIE